MPYVNVRVTPSITAEQSRRLIEEVTDSLVRVLDKKPEHTHIVIDEIDPDRWGFGGRPTSEFRRVGRQ